MRLVQYTVSDYDFPSDGVRKLWAVLARQLFEKQFGMDLHNLEQEEWNALYEACGRVPIITLSDHLLMIATQALGWSGLLATRFAPTLVNKSYFIFNLFMIAIGIIYEWWLIRSLNDSYLSGSLRVRALLRDLRKQWNKSPVSNAASPTQN